MVFVGKNCPMPRKPRGAAAVGRSRAGVCLDLPCSSKLELEERGRPGSRERAVAAERSQGDKVLRIASFPPKDVAKITAEHCTWKMPRLAAVIPVATGV